MKKLGAYIGDSYKGHPRNNRGLEQNTFVWYEVFRCLDDMYGNDVYDVSFWSIKGGYPNGRKPDVKFKTTNKHLIEITIVPMKELANRYCIVWENCNWQIKDCTVRYDYLYNYEYITALKVDQFGSNNYSHWEWEGERAMSVLKDAKVNRVYESNRILEVNEALKIWENKNKETKTMEKKMTETDRFLKSLNDITITSTYSKLKHGFENPYYIYYPEMEITEDIADTLLTVLLMAKRDFIKKIVFNPEKGTTTISKNVGDPVTVRCRDGEFDYILGYEMARSKMYLGHNDYNWFNKIKNHRKTHIEYTEKKPTKKGGKK